MSLNLAVGWLWILLGFTSGMLLGMFFHKENWLGGYGSLKRRMYRLGHISFFGLGTVNLLFALTMQPMSPAEPLMRFASWGFIFGAFLMPLCCLLMAHLPKTHLLFALPVLSLLFAGALTLRLVLHSSHAVPLPGLQQKTRASSSGAVHRKSSDTQGISDGLPDRLHGRGQEPGALSPF